MNKLNIGRCSRCLASKVKVTDKIESNKLFCYKYNKFCQGKSAWCDEAPNGISEEELNKIKKKVEIIENSKLL